MRLLFRLLAGAALVTSLVRAESTVQFGPPLSWVREEQLTQLPPTPPAEASYGYDFLLIDSQVSVRDQGTYAHRVYRVTTEGALQTASRLTLNFEPGYQQLTVHHLHVIRDGQVQDRLKSTPVKVIQQERDLDRHLLNGELTALWVMEDIRVGDVIDYAYTQRGWNPALDRRYFSRIPTGWWVPVRRQNFRLVAPLGRLPKTQSRGPGHSEPVHTREGADEVLTWTGRDLVPIAAEGETPDWYEAYPAMQLSEFASWAQVVRWAEPLYALPDPLPESIRLQAAKLTQGVVGDEARAIALLGFVQQEIRYLGMELGAGSYRPNPPEIVLKRRFGDCKDKVMLFRALARAAGVNVYPALVHTSYGTRIKSWLPTPHAFDHVIAAVVLRSGALGWLDPTLTSQEGGLGWRGLPDYGSALVIYPGNSQFTDIPPMPGSRPKIHFEELIDTPGFREPARLRIRTTYTGLNADVIRRDFAQSTPAEMSKNFVNYYASAYPGLVAEHPPTLTQDAAHDTAFVEEAYTIPALWKQVDGRWKAEFFPKPIMRDAELPATTVRSSPLAISYPVSATLRTTVNLPKVWSLNVREQTMESDGFKGKSGIKLTNGGRSVEMFYQWESKADEIAANRVAQHVEALTQFRQALGHTLTYREAAAGVPKAEPAIPRTNWLPVLVGLITIFVVLLGIREVMRRCPAQPPSLDETGNSDLAGIGGWLYLVAFKVVFTPIVGVFLIYRVFHGYLDLNVWEALTTPGNAGYRLNAGPIILGEFAGNLLFMTVATWLVWLFFRRHRLFPRVFIALLVSNLIFIAADEALITHLWPTTVNANHQTGGDLGRLMIQAIIWIPYMLSSKRVRQTFTR